MNILRSKRFIQQLHHIAPSIREQAWERISLFMMNEYDPLLNNHALKGKYAGSRSINVNGDYRIIYSRIDADTIFFRLIGTHHQLYGK
jgi:addiction module RelE/StbE family toxin